MALRYLLTTNNNSWGVKLNESGIPQYEHIVDFKTSDLKNSFIANELFEGDSEWEAKLKSSSPKGDLFYDENEITFKIDVLKEYPSVSWTTIINRNYCVTFDDKTQDIKFWAVRGATNRNHNIISFSGNRDWMFDLDVKEIFDPNKQAVINRAHVDEVIDSKWNIAQDKENSIVEPIEDFDESNFVLASTDEQVSVVDYKSVFKGTDEQYSDFITEMRKGWDAYLISPSVEQTTNPLKARLYAVTVTSAQLNLFTSTTQVIQTAKARMNTRFGPTNEIMPLINLLVPNSERIRIPRTTESSWDDSHEMFKQMLNPSPNLVKITPMPYSPIHTESINEITVGEDNTFSIVLKTQLSVSQDRPAESEKEIAIDLAIENEPNPQFAVILKRFVDGYDFQSTPRDLLTANYDTDISKPFEVNNIAKLHKYPYEQVYIKMMGGERIVVMPQLLTKEFSWNFLFSFAPDVWHLVISIADLTNENGLYNAQFNYGLRLDVVSPITFPQENNIYLEYLARNYDQVNQQFRKLGWNLVLGALNTATGGLLGGLNFSERNEANQNRENPRSMIGIGTSLVANTALGGLSTMVNSINDIRRQKAMLSDLKRNPSSVEGNAGDPMGILPITPMSPVQFKDELWPELKHSVGQYFHMFGSQLNNRFRDINEYLNTRYYFNYLQTEDLFQNFKININNGAKSLISNSFRNGVWIWHVRDDKFKGVKNFNVNNVQLSLVGEPNA